jgi:hypothetical protein
MFEGYGGPVNVKNVDLSNIDPTLEACCQREIESNRKMNALESTLRRHDRVALAERRQRNVISKLSFGDGCRCCYDTNDGGEYSALTELRALQQGGLVGGEEDDVTFGDRVVGKDDQHSNDDDNGNGNGNADDEESDDDSEFDYLLNEDLPQIGDEAESNTFQLLQQERLEELQVSAMIRESAIQHGFGVHRQFHPSRVFYAAGLGLEGNVNSNNSRNAATIPPAAVIHLNEDCRLSASLDLCLDELAHSTYRGTKFVRSHGRDTMALNADLVQRVLPKLKIDSSFPALIAVKDGVVVALCENLSLFCSGGGSSYNNDNKKNYDQCVESHAVEAWLDRAGVLLHEVAIGYEDYCRIRPEEDALLENMMREKAKLDGAGAFQKEESIFNCGVSGCHKRFSHEHIGIKNEEQSGLLLCKEAAIGE